MTAYVVQVVLLTSVVAPIVLLLAGRRKHRKRSSSWLISGLLQPVAALLLFNAIFVYWFLPSGHRAVTQSTFIYWLSLLSITLAAIWLWRPLLRPFSEPPSPMARLGYILLVTVPQTFVGITMALTQPTYAVAGSILALASKSTLFIAFAILFARVLRESGNESDSDDHDRPSETPPDPGMPGWVASIETGPTVPEPSPTHRPAAGSRRRRPLVRPQHLSYPERKSPAARPRPRSGTGG